MDYDLREWLLILSPVLILAVLSHGYWRMYRSSRGRKKLKMRLDEAFVSKVGDGTAVDDLHMLKAELPNGGARFKKVSTHESYGDRSELGETLKPKAIDHKTHRQPGRIKPSAVEHKRKLGDTSQVEKSIIINVFAAVDSFNGQQLLEVLVNLDMTYGEMNIFHRIGEDGTPDFSLASAVEPGTFDLAKLASQKIPGVTMFMHVHKLVDPEAVYDKMLLVADTIAADLGGLIKDESRSVITAQTIEHCRQEIRDFHFRHSA